MKHCGTKQLETERLILRRFRPKDAATMYKNWASDDEVTKYLTWPTHSSIEVSEFVINDWVNSYNKDDFYQWAIVPKDNNDEPIGSIGMVDSNEDLSIAHIGYCIGRNWWHKGITSEAMNAMKKCDMKYEGTLRQSGRNNQGICDACYYGILRDER